MGPALVLSALLSLPAMQAQSAGVPTFQPLFHIRLQPAVSSPAKQNQSADVSAVQPRFHIRFQPAVSRPVQRDGDREVICGMVVIHKTASDDPKILLPARETGAAVRRIQPQSCGAKSMVTAK